MEFKQDGADASNCRRTKAKQHTGTVTNICPSPGQYQHFPLCCMSALLSKKWEKTRGVLLREQGRNRRQLQNF